MSREMKGFLKSKQFIQAVMHIIFFAVLWGIGGYMIVPKFGLGMFFGVFFISWGMVLAFKSVDE